MHGGYYSYGYGCISENTWLFHNMALKIGSRNIPQQPNAYLECPYNYVELFSIGRTINQPKDLP